MERWQKHLVVATAAMAVVGLAIQPDHCLEAWLEWGLSLPECPVGTLRQTATAEVQSLRRGAEGQVFVGAQAHYTTRHADEAQTVPVTEFRSLELALVDAKNAATPIAVERWEASGSRRHALI